MLTWPATRFVAGEHRDEALEEVRRLNAAGIPCTLDALGENVTEPEQADAARDEYVKLLHGIAEAGVDSNISIKLTMLGLAIDESFCRDRVVTILETALECDNWVRIDMEGSPYVQMTLELFHDVFEEFDNVGTVIQSMLRRSAGDVERLIAAGARIRLVKGAYKEPEPLAYQDKDEVNAEFDRLTEALLSSGIYHAIATHDDARIRHAMEYAEANGVERDAFEFQMLYGVRRETQRDLVDDGWRMRVYVPYGSQWLPYFTRRLRERKENVAFVLRNLLRR